jgi:hypothetical protein
MLWLKWVLGYCVLVAVGLWFLYRSRNVLPSHEPAGAAGYDPARPSQAGEPDPGPRAH